MVDKQVAERHATPKGNDVQIEPDQGKPISASAKYEWENVTLITTKGETE